MWHEATASHPFIGTATRRAPAAHCANIPSIVTGKVAAEGPSQQEHVLWEKL